MMQVGASFDIRVLPASAPLYCGFVVPRCGLPSMRDILADVARAHGVEAADLRQRYVGRHALTPARQEAMWRMHRTGRFSRVQIGQFMGGRHPTTVDHGVAEHERRRAA